MRTSPEQGRTTSQPVTCPRCEGTHVRKTVQTIYVKYYWCHDCGEIWHVLRSSPQMFSESDAEE